MGRGTSASKADWKDGFLFVGNELALDFLNTRPVQNGLAIELLPDSDALVRWFQAAGLLTPHQADTLRQIWRKSSRAHRAVEEFRKLRENLRKQVVRLENGETVHASMLAELNQLMAQHPMKTRVTMNEREPRTELWFEARTPRDLFAPLAHSMATLFASADPGRVRKCGNCVLHFLDTSKKGTRRWCSMQLCGNRAKVAAFAARQRRGKSHAQPS